MKRRAPRTEHVEIRKRCRLAGDDEDGADEEITKWENGNVRCRRIKKDGRYFLGLFKPSELYYYKDGVLEREIYRDDQHILMDICYHHNGKVKSSLLYVNNQLNDTLWLPAKRRFYRTGIPRESRYYKNGKPLRFVSFHHSGVIGEMQYFENGKPIQSASMPFRVEYDDNHENEVRTYRYIALLGGKKQLFYRTEQMDLNNNVLLKKTFLWKTHALQSADNEYALVQYFEDSPAQARLSAHFKNGVWHRDDGPALLVQDRQGVVRGHAYVVDGKYAEFPNYAPNVVHYGLGGVTDVVKVETRQGLFSFVAASNFNISSTPTADRTATYVSKPAERGPPFCPICHETSTGDDGNNLYVQTVCNHVAHKSCMETYLKNNSNCFMCRKMLQ